MFLNLVENKSSALLDNDWLKDGIMRCIVQFKFDISQFNNLIGSDYAIGECSCLFCTALYSFEVPIM